MPLPPTASDAAMEAAHLIDRLDRLARRGDGSAELNPAQWEALRYVARANRFSCNPAALADYLGSTRGTVSQTLIALEQKGLVRRHPSTRDKRSIDLALTDAGRAILRDDPLQMLMRDIAAAVDAEPLASALRATLGQAVARNDGRPFGICQTCRHFRRAARPSARAPYHCALLNEPLSESDSRAICVEQAPAA